MSDYVRPCPCEDCIVLARCICRVKDRYNEIGGFSKYHINMIITELALHCPLLKKFLRNGSVLSYNKDRIDKARKILKLEAYIK